MQWSRPEFMTQAVCAGLLQRHFANAALSEYCLCFWRLFCGLCAQLYRHVHTHTRISIILFRRLREDVQCFFENPAQFRLYKVLHVIACFFAWRFSVSVLCYSMTTLWRPIPSLLHLSSLRLAHLVLGWKPLVAPRILQICCAIGKFCSSIPCRVLSEKSCLVLLARDPRSPARATTPSL